MQSEQTLEELFKMSMQIELKAAEIYTSLEGLFEEYPDISAFWNGLHEDELNHFSILQSVHGNIPAEALSDQVNTTLWKITKGTLDILSGINLNRVRTLDDAYNLAHDMEFSKVNAIFKFLTLDVVPCKQGDAFIDLIINEHLAKLTDFSQNFGDKRWRRSIPAKNLNRQSA
jgi:hypothetical protein